MHGWTRFHFPSCIAARRPVQDPADPRFRKAFLGYYEELVKVGGMTLVERTLRLLVDNGIDEIALIINEGMAEVVRHVEAITLPVQVRIFVKSTESSVDSLYVLSPHLLGQRFILVTLDSFILRQEFSNFVRHFVLHPEVDVLLSYTSFAEVERPLRINVDADGGVVGLGTHAQASQLAISSVCCNRERQPTMRGYPLSRVIDVWTAPRRSKLPRCHT